jgi:predicted dienelactone hydrolase
MHCQEVHKVLFLADAGFAVVTLNHTLDSISSRRESVDNISSFLVRPVDIKRALTFLLGDVQESVDIDSRRIGFFGFSRGGYTGLVLAGAVPDFRAPPFPCPDEFFMCKHMRDNNIPDHGPGNDSRIIRSSLSKAAGSIRAIDSLCRSQSRAILPGC